MAPKVSLIRRESANRSSHVSPGYQAVKPTTFLSLPAELRMQIYGYVLITPFTLRIKRQLQAALGSDLEESEKIARMPDFKPAAFLQTCRTVHDEALTIFFTMNVFYFEMGAQRPFPGTFRRDALALMTNISLEFSLDWFPGFDEHYPESDYVKHIDLGVAAYVCSILEQCPSLQILTYHHLTWDEFGSLLETLDWSVDGVRALKKLTARLDCICIAAGTWHLPSVEFGEMLAPFDDWRIQASASWPQVTLTPKQYYQVTYLMDLDDWMSDADVGTNTTEEGGPRQFYAAHWRQRKRSVLPCPVVAL